MIDYTTAKALKDAGFPQNGNGVMRWKHALLGDNGANDNAYAPTLEELIEACGDNFCSLDAVWAKEATLWTAHSRFDRNPLLKGIAYDPTEAVAKLWLALNTKTV